MKSFKAYYKIKGDRSIEDLQILHGMLEDEFYKGVFKIFECIFEAIPQAYLQAYVVCLQGTDVDLHRGKFCFDQSFNFSML